MHDLTADRHVTKNHKTPGCFRPQIQVTIQSRVCQNGGEDINSLSVRVAVAPCVQKGAVCQVKRCELVFRSLRSVTTKNGIHCLVSYTCAHFEVRYIKFI